MFRTRELDENRHIRRSRFHNSPPISNPPWSIIVPSCIKTRQRQLATPRTSSEDDSRSRFSPHCSHRHPSHPLPQLVLTKGDRISIVCNTLAERMPSRLDGDVSAPRFPCHYLAFRNRGFSGDESSRRAFDAATSVRPSLLTKTKTDFVFAFFCYNDLSNSRMGVAKVSTDLDAYVECLLAVEVQRQKRRPRVVLVFSPIAHEDLRTRICPTQGEQRSHQAVHRTMEGCTKPMM